MHRLLEPRCGGRTTLLERDAATKEAVVKALRESDYAHLATHGEPEGVLLAGAAAALMSSLRGTPVCPVMRAKTKGGLGSGA